MGIGWLFDYFDVSVIWQCDRKIQC